MIEGFEYHGLAHYENSIDMKTLLKVLTFQN